MEYRLETWRKDILVFEAQGRCLGFYIPPEDRAWMARPLDPASIVNLDDFPALAGIACFGIAPHGLGDAWEARGIPLVEALAWKADAGISRAELAASWRSEGFEPTEVKGWLRKLSGAWRTAGLAAALRDAGVGPQDLLAWHQLGKMRPPDIAPYARAGFDPRSARDWFRHEIPAEVARGYADRGWSAGEYAAWRALGLREEVRDAWRAQGFNATAAGAWIEAGLDAPDEARAWRDTGLELAEVRAWRALGVTAVEALERRARGELPEPRGGE